MKRPLTQRRYRLRALVAKRGWSEIEEIAKLKRSPIGWEVCEPFCPLHDTPLPLKSAQDMVLNGRDPNMQVYLQLNTDIWDSPFSTSPYRPAIPALLLSLYPSAQNSSPGRP